jgi:transcriptional regulator with XRE-family HTH domain
MSTITEGKSDTTLSDASSSVRHIRREIGLTEADLALATGTDARTARRWLAGEVSPQRRNKERIDDLRAIVEELEDSLTPKGIRQWLRARNRVLDGERPIERLGRRDFDAVYKAAQAFAEGYYI